MVGYSISVDYSFPHELPHFLSSNRGQWVGFNPFGEVAYGYYKILQLPGYKWEWAENVYSLFVKWLTGL